MITIAELKLREYLLNLQKQENLCAGEMLKILDKEKEYFMRSKTDSE